MYIACQLPNEYGAFKQIQKENYPFSHTFETYISTLAQIGLDAHLNIDELIGFVEDKIYKENRVSDIPMGDEPINFRLKTHNPIIMSYYQKQDIPNRYITLLLIRMTLRLSVTCGTSLSRITYKVKTLATAPIPDEVVVVPQATGIGEQVALLKKKPIKERSNLSALNNEKKKQEMAQRLESLVKKGDEVLEQEDDTIVVNTNPLLKDFMNY